MDSLISTANCLLVPLVIITLGYTVLCAVQPFKPCRRCHGAGVKALLFGRTRYCKRCKGKGAKLRLGMRLVNHLHRLRSDLAGRR